jgi:hypothetical protein
MVLLALLGKGSKFSLVLMVFLPLFLYSYYFGWILNSGGMLVLLAKFYQYDIICYCKMDLKHS